MKKDKEATLKAHRDVTVGLMSGITLATAFLITYYSEEIIPTIMLVIVFLAVYLIAIGVIALIDVWFLKRKFNYLVRFGFLFKSFTVGGVILACFIIVLVYLNIIATYISLIIAVISFFISLIALGISSESKTMMQSLADLNFDEKIAMMVSYKKNIAVPNKPSKKLDDLNKCKYDLRAVSNLKQWASDRRKKELIMYVSDVIKGALTKNHIIDESKLTKGDVENYEEILGNIIEIALKIGPENKVLKTLKQQKEEYITYLFSQL